MADDLKSPDNQSEHAEAGLYDFSPATPVFIEADKASQSGVGKSADEDWQRKSGRSGSLWESFYHAFNGLLIGFRLQRNVRIHLCVAIAVFVLAFYLKVQGVELIALVLATGFVLFAEFVNTAIEHVVDIQTQHQYQLPARYAKDTAAAAVLLAALTAVVIGGLVFAPKLLALL